MNYLPFMEAESLDYIVVFGALTGANMICIAPWDVTPYSRV
jgi:hypothetical protein